MDVMPKLNRHVHNIGDKNVLSVYSDANWASGPSRHSTTGGMYILPLCPHRDVVEDAARGGAFHCRKRTYRDDDGRPGGPVREAHPVRAGPGDKPEGLQDSSAARAVVAIKGRWTKEISGSSRYLATGPSARWPDRGEVRRHAGQPGRSLHRELRGTKTSLPHEVDRRQK
eukprot:3672004-Heterocapsa_arctica.AAC.1